MIQMTRKEIITFFNFRGTRAIEKLLTDGWTVTFRSIKHRGLVSATATHEWHGIQECGIGTTLKSAISKMLDKITRGDSRG